jgi:mannosyltransferase OCH1-like enzyme
MDYESYLTTNVTYLSGSIPKIIHQVWINDLFLGRPKRDPPSTSREKWKHYHPDWKYMLWTDEFVDHYLQTYHPEYVELYQNYEYLIQRADMIRYFILYDYGGLYCDIDMFPLRNIDHYITAPMDHFVYSANGDTIINGFMIVTRYSPIMKRVQENLRRKQPYYMIGKHLTVLMTTGPMLLNHTLLNDIKFPFVIIPRKMFNPYSIVTDKNITDNVDDMYINTVDGNSSWNSYDTFLFNFILRHKEFFIMFGVMSIIVIIAFLIYYIVKYKKCKETCEI